MEIWHILITLGFIALIFEIFTLGFIFAAIGVGFFISALGSYMDLDTKWLILLFAVGVALTYFLVKPIFRKFGYGKESIQTNHFGLIGKTGIVTEEINNESNRGRIKIDGDDWRAIAKTNIIIPTGSTVNIIEIESIILIVEPIN